MGISIWQLLIILAIVLVLFGAKRLRNVGSDLGGAIKGFKSAMKDEEEKRAEAEAAAQQAAAQQQPAAKIDAKDGNVFDAQAQQKQADAQTTPKDKA